MKKIGLLSTLLVGSLLLAGCNCNCNNNSSNSEAKTICLENKGTYSWVTSSDEEYGECRFPSGVGCRDEYILDGQCDWEADISNIDTAEERQNGCEENVDGWMQDMMVGAVYFGIEWDGDEVEITDEEGNLTMISRNFYAKYERDGQNWKLPGTCEANFVDGSLGTTYNEEFLDE